MSHLKYLRIASRLTAASFPATGVSLADASMVSSDPLLPVRSQVVIWLRDEETCWLQLDIGLDWPLSPMSLDVEEVLSFLEDFDASVIPKTQSSRNLMCNDTQVGSQGKLFARRRNGRQTGTQPRYTACAPTLNMLRSSSSFTTEIVLCSGAACLGDVLHSARFSAVSDGD